MLETAIGAKRRATKEGHDVIGYDFDKKCWFTTVQGQPEGHFDGTGRFHEHKCVYLDRFKNDDYVYELSKYIIKQLGE